MAVSPAPLPGGGVLHRCRSGPHTLPGAGHPPPPHLRPGSLWMAGGIPAHHPPPVPSLQYCDWRLRDSDPGMASASMGSVFCLLTSSSFCPSSAYRESLGYSLSSGRPFCPFHPGLPRCPGFGATGGRRFPPLPIREAERWNSLPIAPPGAAPVTGGCPGMLPLTGPRRRRRAGFRRHPQFILQRYRDSSPRHQDPHAAGAIAGPTVR
jgi:hypothetical protein